MTRAAWASVVLGLAGMVFAASFYLTMKVVFSGREVTVPDVTGMPVEHARAALAAAQLNVQEDEGRYDEKVPAGQVRSQDPLPGATTKKNRKVRVSVSLGPLKLQVPDVRGSTLRSARLALEREGLKVGFVTRASDQGIPAEVVMAQDPGPGGAGEGPRPVGGRSDGAVDLLVSAGPEPARFIMPDLTGRRSAEVTDFARRARLRLGPVRREPSPGMPRGVVLRQSPAPGQPVERQDIISLVLSE